MEKITITVSGMNCQGCVKSVTSALSALPGVSEVSVSLEAGKAVVGYDAQQVTPAAMREAIESAGFDAA